MADPVKPETKVTVEAKPSSPPPPPPSPAKKVAVPAVVEPVPEPAPTLREQVADKLAALLRADSFKERRAIANQVLELIPE